MIFLNRDDIARLGFEAGQWVDLVGESDDDVTRRVDGFYIAGLPATRFAVSRRSAP